jgi:TPR repeat protein
MLNVIAALLITFALALGPERAAAGPLEDGFVAHQAGDYRTALRLWWPLAEQGHAWAQYYLGNSYNHGQGVPQDHAEAVKWYRRAADQGHALAQHDIGNLYSFGWGVTQDDAQAARWHRKAADQGHAASEAVMAILYDDGRGVPQDHAEALKWYRKAADRGNSIAQYFVGNRYEDGLGVRQDFAEAARWYRMAADQGYADAQHDLGIMYVYGKGVPRSDAEAVKWFRLAANQGNISSQSNLGIMYANGHGVPQNHAEAMKWYRLAADQGNAVSQNNLGFIFAKGQGVPRNYAEAARWFRKAADQGIEKAQEALGVLYQGGDGVPQDFVQAHMWYNLSASQELRDKLARRMTTGQIAEAQRLASEWRPKVPNPFDQFQGNPQAPTAVPQQPALHSTGSGFFVTRDGHLLTNAHVVTGCNVVQARRADGAVADVRVLATSPRDDLALLKVEQRQASAATFRGGGPVKQGEGVTVYGFPMAGLLASTGNLTIGNVTALSGPRDDPRLLQISAPVQLGNSGGPVFDTGGNVVGVVVSKLNALAVAGATGDVPQNINFAIKASVATNFLEAQGVAYVLAPSSVELAASAVVDRARAGTVRVDCLK